MFEEAQGKERWRRETLRRPAFASFKAELLIIGHELFEALAALGEMIGLISEYIRQRHTPLIAHHAHRQIALVDYSNQKRSRHIQKIGRLLRCNLGLDRNQCDSMPCRGFSENIEQ
jgi:hypothetical protein